MSDDPSIRLALYFTRGMSLRAWDESGSFDREVALYRRLQREGVDITFVTHGDGRDLALQERLPGFRILCNRWRLPSRLYRPLMARLHSSGLRRVNVIKTNQTLGADLALAAAQRHGKPLIARCGFMLSFNEAQDHGADSPRAREALALEEKAFRAAMRVVVTTDRMRASVLNRMPELANRVTVIPNYVDTELFSPAERLPTGKARLAFVGRLSPEKNLLALTEALKGLDADFDIIGDGPLRPQLEDAARENPRIRLLGSLANTQLPAQLRKATAYVQTSLFEGHPKTVIEAMACGLPVIGTDVPGIREVVHDGETGLLCGTDAKAIRGALERMLSDGALRDRMGAAARRHAVAHFSLDRIVEDELALLRAVLNEHRGA
jgi:glycosyltransferase involved in cell wall biosynthesis